MSAHDILDKFRAKPKTDDASPMSESPPATRVQGLHLIDPRGALTPPHSQEEYVAARQGSGKETKLRIVFHPGHQDLFAYWNLARVICTNSNEMTLMYSDNTEVNLRGYNLTALIEPLQDDEVRSLHLFDAERYELPQEGETVITEIIYGPILDEEQE